MAMLLAFAPFLTFMLVERTLGIEAGLLAAVAASLLLLARETLLLRRSAKLLELGTALLFGALAVFTWVTGAAWSVAGIRLAVDAGLLLIVLASLAIGQPFTLQYAREAVPAAVHQAPAFHRTNRVITSVWGLAFAAMVAVDLAWVVAPELPPRVVLVVTVLAILGAVKFTGWYPSQAQAPTA